MSLIGLPAGIEEMLIAAVIVFCISLVYKFFINHNELRELKQKQKDKQKELKELQKENPEQAKKVMNEMLAMSNKQMRMTMKPMFITLIISVLVILPVLPQLFPGPVVYLPFTLPYFGNDFGWLAWYFIVSIPLNSIIRKILGVEI